MEHNYKRIDGINEGKQIHGHVLKLGLSYDVFIHTSLINFYSQSGELDDARLVFDKSPLRDPVSFTALITGYISRERFKDARKLFDEMPLRDVVSWNSIIAGHTKIQRFQEAIDLFKEMQIAKIKPNESTLVTVLSACAQSGCLTTGGYAHTHHYKESMDLFRIMLQSNHKPNEVTLLMILPTCAHMGALDLGKWIHAYINKNIPESSNPSLSTSLIDMYAKCGDIEAAKSVFESLKHKSLASWNAMISGLAMHRQAHKAIELFKKMVNDGFTPDDITFVGVLSACSHGGLVNSGRHLFHSMIQDFKILPKLQHYGCMIDLLGRAGLFEEAMDMIKKMEVNPDGAIWGSLLGACTFYQNTLLGEFFFKKVVELDPESSGAHVMLSNLYAANGQWDDVARIRTKFKDDGSKKIPGCTSIEIDGIVHEFLASDRTHPMSDQIYAMLEETNRVLEKSGYVLDTSLVLYDMDDEWKEGQLCQHSERLAIAFGLISTKPGTTIRIMKNLRVCSNCHSATKLISKIFEREIIARDRNRFHHFKNGICTCMDQWDITAVEITMPKKRRDHSASTDKSRRSPYKCNTKNKNPSEKDQNLKEWEEAKCPVCMEHPHNAILLLCSSHSNNCRPYMCDTSRRHSNCFNQFRKSFVTPATTSEPPSTATFQESKMVCPLCRGQVKGWVVVEAAREFMNAKSRSCSSGTCEFSGTYSDLRRHARVVHPLVRPSEADPGRQQDWRRLESERNLGDLLRNITRFNLENGNLKALVLSSNSFTGGFPEKLCSRDSNLRHLFISSNRLSGDFPFLVLICSSIEVVGISGNNFGNEIPSGIHYLKNLIDLLLNNNSFSGSLPSEIGNLSNLVNLYLFGNMIIGPLLETFSHLKNLTIVNISQNRFSGSISPLMGSDLLLLFDSTNNSFSGFIPSKLARLTRLSGGMPEEIENLTGLNVPKFFKETISPGKFLEHLASVRNCSSLGYQRTCSQRAIREEIMGNEILKLRESKREMEMG
ncbi:unnamed protein product [Lactuca saligna]|uniref:DYW domain-containing protein n=1 Tax=Lactuca saligna TaxID=75948 RepID=A0AA35ZKJ3_LACSI|nr:unnamed protein product [Lactuca saligna]